MILQIMRQRRIERGAITLASAEVKFQIDTETHDPLDIGRFFLYRYRHLFLSITTLTTRRIPKEQFSDQSNRD